MIAYIDVSKIQNVKINKSRIFYELWSADVLINLLKLFSIDYVNIYFSQYLFQ